MKEQEKKVTDPGAEMKARALQLVRFDDRNAEPYCVSVFVNGQWYAVSWPTYSKDAELYALRIVETLATFAAKEVARAVEEERMACINGVCVYCKTNAESLQNNEVIGWAHFMPSKSGGSDVFECKASAIHERSQVKGEGL